MQIELVAEGPDGGEDGAGAEKRQREAALVEAPLSEDRGFTLTFRWLFQGARPPERHTSEQSVCGRPLPRSALLSQFGFVSPEASFDTSGSLQGL